MEIEIELDPQGPVAQGKASVQWVQEDEQGAILTAEVAGHPITAIQVSREPTRYELQYLGMIGRGFDSQAFALFSAPAFAEQVLQYLANMASQTVAMPNEAEQ